MIDTRYRSSSSFESGSSASARCTAYHVTTGRHVLYLPSVQHELYGPPVHVDEVDDQSVAAVGQGGAELQSASGGGGRTHTHCRHARSSPATPENHSLHLYG